MRLRIAIAGEFSGIFREAFTALGHDAWSIDRLETEIPGQHIVGDYVEELYTQKWDLAVCHPVCQYLCLSGARWMFKGGRGTERDPERWAGMEAAAKVFRAFLDAPVERIAIENPLPGPHAVKLIGRSYDFKVSPYHFGIREMKTVCWWTKNLPPLVPTNNVGPPPKDPELRKHWAKVHRASPGPNRWKERSRSYPGMAKAAAMQWAGPA